ncbi:hypothetical protein GGR51DRAFT_560963 [Nemania sp. FL0031]|nr:hypothetical protein GGR51DRAFT_560963 [Nemania sp. FL0031]
MRQLRDDERKDCQVIVLAYQYDTLSQENPILSRSREARVLTWHIAKRVSTILMIPVDNFEIHGTSIASYGLDSIIGVKVHLATEAAQQMGV